MKILALMTDAYGGQGGIAQYNRDLLDALVAMPEVSHVASLTRLAPSQESVLPPKLNERVGARSKVAYLAQALRMALVRRPEVILCGHINLLPLAALATKLLRVPLVLELYGIEAWLPRSSMPQGWCLRQVGLAISISRFTRHKFLAWACVRPAVVRVVPNAIHLDRYAPRPKPAYLVDRYRLHGKLVLLTLGRLSASEGYKGQDRIIQVMPELLKRRPDLMYVIAGDGDDRGRLESLARVRGVSHRVQFIGHVPQREVMDHYNVADAFAMPSTGEGFGFVFLEASACGLPVLGGSLDGSPDALADGRIGSMVDPNDESALREGVLRLFDQPRSVPDALRMYDSPHFDRQIRQLMVSASYD